MTNSIKLIGFDADDTLWVNEPYYRETEEKFCSLLNDHAPEDITKELYKTELDNLELYGFGAKSFVLSMVETALKFENGQDRKNLIDNVLKLGKELINKPLVLLEGVERVLEELSEMDYKLILVTKGDLLDQERKLRNSKLEKYFHHIEIMSNKAERDYQKLIDHLDISAEEFLMIGNSLKSDILPVVNIGSHAIYIPYHTVWIHEEIDEKQLNREKFHTVEEISRVPQILSEIN